MRFNVGLMSMTGRSHEELDAARRLLSQAVPLVGESHALGYALVIRDEWVGSRYRGLIVGPNVSVNLRGFTPVRGMAVSWWTTISGRASATAAIT